MNILDKIVNSKAQEIGEKKSLFPIKLLERSVFFNTQPLSLKKYLLRDDKSGIIAEIKRRSPSKGILNSSISVEKISIGYMQAGASAISILTDKEFFGGKNEDLTEARKFNFCPILRKEFILDEYQVLESKSIGADAILLIAGILSEKQIANLLNLSKSLGMEVMVEVHNQQELNKVRNLNCDILGVNNRDLTSFETTLETSKILSDQIPNRFIKVSESGIRKPEDIIMLRDFGYHGFLIGELFMKKVSPEDTCRNFIEKLKDKILVR